MGMDVETIQTLLAIVAGGVIIPIVGFIKTTVVVKYIRPEFITLALLALAAWGAVAYLYPEVPIEFKQVLDLALVASGATSILYGGTKLIKSNGK